MATVWKATRVRTPLTANKFPAANTAGIDRDLNYWFDVFRDRMEFVKPVP